MFPSKTARDLVRGAIDMHVHSGPDVIQRIAHDIEIAQRFREVGLAGYVIKSHYAPTAGRAALARAMVPEVNVMGSITLNQSVGGMNALAVEMAAREGARLVWFPTVDAENEPVGRRAPVAGANIPFWAHMQHQLRAEGVFSEAVAVVDGEMNVLPETRRVLQSIAKHDMILASDLGQPNKPPIEDGLAIAADQALAAGFSKDEVHRMFVVNTQRLVG